MGWFPHTFRQPPPSRIIRPSSSAHAEKPARVKSVVISLVGMTERRSLIESQFEALGLGFDFLDAVDARKNEHVRLSRYDEAATMARYGAPLSAPEIGCFASHFAAWQLCVERDEPLAIFEDDVLLDPRFPEVLALAAARIEQHRLIRLFGKHNRSSRQLEALGSRYTLVRFQRGPIGTQCYCLSPAGARALLARATRWSEPVDHYLDRFWLHGVTSNAIVPYELKEMSRDILVGAIGARSHRRTGMAKFRRELTRQTDALARLIYNIRHWPR